MVKMQSEEHVALQDEVTYLKSQMKTEPDRNVLVGAG
jgi:hypothetical protein